MSKQADAVKINILDKEYLVACADDERDALEASARYLGDKMAEIRGTGKVVGIDRIAVMAGLNLAHEAIEGGGAGGDTENTASARLHKLNDSIGKTLAKFRRRELN